MGWLEGIKIGQVWLIDRVADLADDAGDALAIYAVKRSV